MESLKLSLGILICVLGCAFYGCGSDNGAGSPASQKEQKPTAGEQPLVQELLTKPNSEEAVAGRIEIPASDPDLEVLPPEKPGGKGITQRELDAMRAKAKTVPVDPDDLEILPPSVPGGKGITQRELNAMRTQEEKAVDLDDLEIIPPSVEGGMGITQKELNAAARMKSAEETDPRLLEVIPPAVPGGRGVTQEELDAFRPPPMPGETGANPTQ